MNKRKIKFLTCINKVKFVFYDLQMDIDEIIICEMALRFLKIYYLFNPNDCCLIDDSFYNAISSLSINSKYVHRTVCKLKQKCADR